MRLLSQGRSGAYQGTKAKGQGQGQGYIQSGNGAETMGLTGTGSIVSLELNSMGNKV